MSYIADSKNNRVDVNKIRANTWNVQHFGAVGDGKTTDTTALQATIDACHSSGGGVVHVTAGRYLTGSIELRSNICLHIHHGATLLASTNLDDYRVVEPLSSLLCLGSQWEKTHRTSALLYAVKAKNVSIVGGGTIFGQGKSFIEPIDEPLCPEWVPGLTEVPHYWYTARPRPEMLVGFFECEGVDIRNVNMRDSFAWNLCFFLCDSVNVRGIRVRNSFEIPNSDGIDIISTSNAKISDCDIYAADDAICLKNLYADNPGSDFRDRPCKNVNITNCVITTPCNGIKLGTDSEVGFENICINNCVISGEDPGDRIACPISGISLESVDGGSVCGVTVSNIVMENVRAPLFLRLGNRGRMQEVPKPGTLEDIVIDNLVVRNASICATITGLPGHNVRGVSLSNIKLEMLGAGTSDLANSNPPERPAYYPESTMFGRLPSYGLYCRHAEEISLRNINICFIKPDGRPAVTFEDVKNTTVDALSMPATDDGQPEVKLNNCRDIMIRGCRAPADKNFLLVNGKQSDHIVVMSNDFLVTDHPVVISDDVRAEAVVLSGNCERETRAMHRNVSLLDGKIKHNG